MALRFLPPTSPTQLVASFFKEDGPAKIVFYYQVPEEEKNGDLVPIGTDKKVMVLSGDESLRLQNKCVYFMKNTKKQVSTKDADLAQELLFGVIDNNFLGSFESVLKEVYMPLLTAQNDWGKSTDEQTKEFLASVHKFADSVTEVTVASRCLGKTPCFSAVS